MLSHGALQAHSQLSSRRHAAGEESGFGKGVARRCSAAPDASLHLCWWPARSGLVSPAISAALKSHTPCDHFLQQAHGLCLGPCTAASLSCAGSTTASSSSSSTADRYAQSQRSTATLQPTAGRAKSLCCCRGLCASLQKTHPHPAVAAVVSKKEPESAAALFAERRCKGLASRDSTAC